MKIGAHVSIAGGLTKAIKQAQACGAECFQIFLRSPRGGRPPALTVQQIKEFKIVLKASGLGPVFVHASYLVNLASEKKSVVAYSLFSVRDDLERASVLGLEAVVVHTGSAVGITHEAGLKNVVKNVQKILKGYKGSAKLLLEISAGSGDCVGRTLEELAGFLKQIKNKKVGVCLDTAHSFASGYDLAYEVGVKKYFSSVEKLIGWDKVGLIHANDSKVALGKLVDRHEHLGLGEIGEPGLKIFFARQELKNKCVVIETPKEKDDSDIKNLKKLRAWRK